MNGTNHYVGLARAAGHLKEYCDARVCEGCPLDRVCGYGGMKLRDFLEDAAANVERPAMMAEFASKR